MRERLGCTWTEHDTRSATALKNEEKEGRVGRKSTQREKEGK
jgi:hypothetical protein